MLPRSRPATAAAMKDGADLFDVVPASIYGAAKGDQIGREIGQTLAGASVETRIRWAVNIAMNAKNLDEAIDEIEDNIGSGLMTVEAVPARNRSLRRGKGQCGRRYLRGGQYR